MQLYDHLPPITKTIKIRRTRHPGNCWRSRDELISNILPWIPSHGRANAGRPAIEPIYNNSVPIQDVSLKTYRERWTIETGGGGRSRRSVLAARNDDNIYIYIYNIYIYIYVCVCVCVCVCMCAYIYIYIYDI